MFKDSTKLFEAVRTGFHNCRVLVVGDLMLDRYVWGVVERISPEAPAPVVRLDHKTRAAGGAANVAVNLSTLGCKVDVAGAVGEDEDGRELLELLEGSGIETSAVVSIASRPTTCKTRILAGRQQMLRLDAEKAGELSPVLRERLLSAIDGHISGFSAIILSDYAKGVVDDSICQAIIARAHDFSIPVFVDPKGTHYQKYAGCDVVSPNRMELAAVTSTDYGDLELMLQKGELLRSNLGLRHLLVTLGELGMALLDPSGLHRFPAQAREVFDVSGAGDTVIATIAVAVAAGLHLHDAIHLANLAAGIVIGKLGTSPIAREELLAALASEEGASQAEKICSLETLLNRVAQWRLAGRRIVFTDGRFDLFHVGHLALLEQAKRQGERLVVGLNTDRSVRILKGVGHPIVSERARAQLVAALPCVDAVVFFDDETPLKLIRALRPHVLVRGSECLEEEIVGRNEVKTWGGKVALIPLLEDSSTTEILKRAGASLSKARPDLIQ